MLAKEYPSQLAEEALWALHTHQVNLVHDVLRREGGGDIESNKTHTYIQLDSAKLTRNPNTYDCSTTTETHAPPSPHGHTNPTNTYPIIRDDEFAMCHCAADNDDAPAALTHPLYRLLQRRPKKAVRTRTRTHKHTAMRLRYTVTTHTSTQTKARTHTHTSTHPSPR